MTMRDFMFGRIGGTVGIGNTPSERDDRRVIAEYLIMSLNDYLDRGCVAPALGEPFPEVNNNNA